MDHCLTAQDMARIFVSDKGSRKNVGDRAFYTVLNKCDDTRRLDNGMQVVRELGSLGQQNAVLTAFTRAR